MMSEISGETEWIRGDRPRPPSHRSLAGKYATYGALLVSALLAGSGLVYGYFAWRDAVAAQSILLEEKARLVAIRIGEFGAQVAQPLAWAAEGVAAGGGLPPGSVRLELIRLLRHVGAITDARWIDATGRERVLVSRFALDTENSGRDFSADPVVTQALAKRSATSPVRFERGTEPFLTMVQAVPGPAGGVIVADVNLKFVSDVLAREHIGEQGTAFVLDARGQLVSHADVTEVLRRADYASVAAGVPHAGFLSAFAKVDRFGWTVFAELPENEALEPVFRGLARTLLLVVLGVAVAIATSVALARRLLRPISALERGASELGEGRLDRRIDVRTGDEIEALGEQFNRMAARLQESHTSLESRIAERTRDLSIANEAKTRFLAAASHDLRQPMHALSLFVAQLRHDTAGMVALAALVRQIEGSVDALRQLLDSLLDLSKLDAGAVAAQSADFALQPLLDRLAEAFAPPAGDKGLAFVVHPTSLWVRSDPRLLERILLNFAANAVRYTARGRIVAGCHRRGADVEIVVADTGRGIAESELPLIFREFHQAGGPDAGRDGGLGLGLAIVDRLARLLDHEVHVTSRLGRGSAFSIRVPRALEHLRDAGNAAAPQADEPLAGRRVLVIDDDDAARSAMAGLLRRWGCDVDEAADGGEARALARLNRPDAAIGDLRLREGENGMDVLDALRALCVPPPATIIVTGDFSADCEAEARRRGHPILPKPVPPAKVRALLEQLLRERA
jgi:signal transduction histidine kinase/ActR/RegA family two-component response regulator